MRWPSSRSLLLLDEPASGLSVEETQDVAFWIEDIKTQMGITVLMVEHDMHLVVGGFRPRAGAGRRQGAGSRHRRRRCRTHPKVIEAYIGVSDPQQKVVA